MNAQPLQNLGELLKATVKSEVSEESPLPVSVMNFPPAIDLSDSAIGHIPVYFKIIAELLKTKGLIHISELSKRLGIDRTQVACGCHNLKRECVVDNENFGYYSLNKDWFNNFKNSRGDVKASRLHRYLHRENLPVSNKVVEAEPESERETYENVGLLESIHKLISMKKERINKINSMIEELTTERESIKTDIRVTSEKLLEQIGV